MKLRNKKTGEIGDILPYGCEDGKIRVWIDNISRPEYRYNSLAELNSEWEDYEEPKTFWFIDEEGIIRSTTDENWPEESVVAAKSIGDYFETKEEAEKAVEKLKALTEAKEDGLKIKGYYYNHEDLVILADIGKCNKLTLDTLFGKEID